MGYTNRCQCLPSYTPPNGGPVTCPDECLQAASIIYPFEEGLECAGELVIDLASITSPGNCDCGVTFSATAVDSEGEALDVELVGTTLTITNNITDESAVGEVFVVNYIMSCNCDVRSIMGTIAIPITSVCEI
jgi:hypothetical protein